MDKRFLNTNFLLNTGQTPSADENHVTWPKKTKDCCVDGYFQSQEWTFPQMSEQNMYQQLSKVCLIYSTNPLSQKFRVLTLLWCPWVNQLTPFSRLSCGWTQLKLMSEKDSNGKQLCNKFSNILKITTQRHHRSSVLPKASYLRI